MQQLLTEQSKLTTQADQLTAALERAAGDIEQLTELKAQHAALRARRQDRVAAAFLANTTADTKDIDAELATMADQIAALVDAPATHGLLSDKLANVQVAQEKNQVAINKIIADRMLVRFKEAEQDFADATVKLGNSLVKMQSALVVTRLIGGNNVVLRDQYRNYVGDGFYVKGLTRIADRDVLAEAQAAEMLENLKSEGVTLL